MSKLSRVRIAEAAVKLVDDEGLDALTMRRLGVSLGVEAMSLYRHVRNKADLLDDPIIIEEEIQVDGARPHGDVSYAPHLRFDCRKDLEELSRLLTRLTKEHRVEKEGLVNSKQIEDQSVIGQVRTNTPRHFLLNS